MDIDWFREIISHYGLNPEEALEVIKNIYLAEELSREVCQGYTYSDKIFCNELYKVSKELIEVLKSLGVVSEHAIGTYGTYGKVWSDFKAKRISLKEADKLIRLSGRVWILTLTDIGKRLAIQYLDNFIENNRDLITKIINKYNRKLLGFLRYLSSDKVRYIRVNEYFEKKPLPLENDFHQWLARLININKVFHTEITRLMEDLTRLGLAIKTSTYTSKGIYIHKEYRTSFYVIKKITELTKIEYPREAINNLYVIHLVQMAVVDHNYMNELKQLLSDSSLRAKLYVFLDILYSKGATTRLNILSINTDVTMPLFIVIDKNEFEKQLINTVDHILRSLVVK